MKLYRNFMFPSFLSLSLQNRVTATVSRGEKQTQTSGCMVSKNFTLTSSNSNGWHKSVQVKLPKHKKNKCPANVMTTRSRGDVMRAVGRFRCLVLAVWKKNIFFFKPKGRASKILSHCSNTQLWESYCINIKFWYCLRIKFLNRGYCRVVRRSSHKFACSPLRRVLNTQSGVELKEY